MIFRRIFNFEPEKVEQLEKRLAQRHVPGAGFPLKAKVRYAGRHSRATIQDISSNGLRLMLLPRGDLQPGHHLRADLDLGEHRLQLEARIAHVNVVDGHLNLGLSLVFNEPEARKSYYQLLQPVAIGQTLKVMAPETVVQDLFGFTKRIYVGDSDTQLTVWHEQRPGEPPHRFEFRMADYFCRGKLLEGRADAGALESQGETDPGLSRPVFDTSGGLHDEICQLYRWVLPNMATTVPADTRAFLQLFAG